MSAKFFVRNTFKTATAVSMI